MSVGDVLAGCSPWHIETGDSLTVLKTIPDGVFQSCCTSPPYFSLRDYQTGTWEGGSPECDHMESKPSRREVSKASSGLEGSKETIHFSQVSKRICGRCGARRIDQQIGLEDTPEEFIAKLVAVFHEVKRVLRDDGTLWVNMGDSYQNKSLLGMPWKLAEALRADGWLLRSEIIWCKVSPMPASVRDRPTTAHEQIFLLVKQGKYFYDMEAERVPMAEASTARYDYHFGGHKNLALAEMDKAGMGNRIRPIGHREPTAGRNLWSYWTDLKPTQFAEAHFATYPLDLPLRCYRLGASLHGCCPVCGAPWKRVTNRTPKKRSRPNEYVKRNGEPGTGNSCGNTVAGVSVETLGWQPSCKCPPADRLGSLTLDPFAGAGTSGVAARSLGMRHVGIELNPEYADLARKRIREYTPLADCADTTPLPAQMTLFEDDSQ